MEIEAEVRFKNAYVKKFIRKYNMTLKEISEKIDMNYQTFIGFVSFKLPLKKQTDRDKVFNFFKEFDPELKIEKLFPHNLSIAINLFSKRRIISKEVDLDKYLPNEERIMLPIQHSELESQEIKKAAKIALSQLSDKRWYDIVKYHYGIDCDELSITKISNKFGISIERVRQIILESERRIKKTFFSSYGYGKDRLEIIDEKKILGEMYCNFKNN